MSQIAEIARQTNAATQDASQSVSYLADLAEQLRASVATFRLPEQIAEQAGLPQQAQAPFGAPQLGSGGSGASWEVPADALIGAGVPTNGFDGASQPGNFAYGSPFGAAYDGVYNGYGAPPDGQSAWPHPAGQDAPWPPAGEAPYPPDQFDGRYGER
jgi:hypothetical protein